VFWYLYIIQDSVEIERTHLRYSFRIRGLHKYLSSDKLAVNRSSSVVQQIPWQLHLPSKASTDVLEPAETMDQMFGLAGVMEYGLEDSFDKPAMQDCDGVCGDTTMRSSSCRRGRVEGYYAVVIVSETIEATKVRSQTRPLEKLVERLHF